MENNNYSEKKEMTFIEIMNYIESTTKKIFTYLLYAFLKFIRFTYKNIIIISISVITAFLAGGAWHFFKPIEYEATGTLYIYGTPASMTKDIISKLDFTLVENKFSPENNVIKKISSYYFVDLKKDGIPDLIYYKPYKKISSDTNSQLMNDRLFLKMILQSDENNQDMDIVCQVLNKLNNHPLLVKNFEFYKKSLMEKADLCVKEIHRIDSLSNKMYFENTCHHLQLSGEMLNFGKNEVQLFYENLFNLQEKKEEIMSNFHTLNTPVAFPAGIIIQPYHHHTIWYYFIKYFFIGFSLGIITSLFVKNRKQITAFLRS